MKTQIKLAKTPVYAALLAGLIGFSGTSLAQANAIQVLNQNADDASRDTATAGADHRATERLADAVDAYNRQASAGLVPDTRIPAGEAQNPADHRAAQQLGERVDAYNENATESLTLDTWIPASQSKDTVAPVIDELKADVNAYNRTGGLQTL